MTVPRRFSTRDEVINAAIAELVKEFSDPFDRRLLEEMVSAVYLLGKDEATTGDLKILNTTLKELRYAFKTFRPYRHTPKVAVFGSARTASGAPSYRMAKRFGKLMADAGWGVITGAASGIMAAGHEGAGREASFGLNIRLPFEQDANPVIAEDGKLVNHKYFFTRKLMFIKESKATVLFPGGFGTLDEGFESLTLVQTGKCEPRPTVFVDTPDKAFWTPLLRFMNKDMVQCGMISAWDRSLYHVVTSAAEARDFILCFYSVYHSSRFVREKLVMRLNLQLDAGQIEYLNKEFRDMLSDGEIEPSGALPEEAQEVELKDLPRLVIPFDRHRYGRLIQMIACINELGKPALRLKRA